MFTTLCTARYHAHSIACIDRVDGRLLQLSADAGDRVRAIN